MSIMRYDPWSELGTLRDSMDQLLDEFFGRRRRPVERRALAAWAPAIEMYEEGDQVVVRAELPNVDPKQVDVTVTQDAITIRGSSREETERRDRNYHVRELRAGSFTRTLALPTEVQGDAAKATFAHGLLEVRIPKSERVKPRSVKVEVQAQ